MENNEPNIKDNICSYIDNWLTNHKEYNNASFGKLFGISNTSVIRWRNHECIPDINLFPKLCNIFGISLSSFLGVDDITESNNEKELVIRYRSNPPFKSFIDKYLLDEKFAEFINSIVNLPR